MNENHARLCSSPEWMGWIADELMPHLTHDVDLGAYMLELGPGPGAATEWLRHRVRRLTAAEVDEQAALALTKRYAGTNVEVIVADATRLRLPDCSFDSVGCFTMLHHIPTSQSQSDLLVGAFRVLRPGGVFIGADSLASSALRDFHNGDTYNPIAPPFLLARLLALGFTGTTMVVDDDLRFIARKPSEDSPGTNLGNEKEVTQCGARR
jgi:SAM-dependent methyltransferase